MRKSIRRPLSILLLVGLAGCPGTSGSGTLVTPGVELTFPPSLCLLEADTVTVRGTARGGVRAVQVSGREATSTDGFKTWQVEVSLLPGTNVLNVTAQKQSGQDHVSGQRADQRCDTGQVHKKDWKQVSRQPTHVTYEAVLPYDDGDLLAKKPHPDLNQQHHDIPNQLDHRTTLTLVCPPSAADRAARPPNPPKSSVR